MMATIDMSRFTIDELLGIREPNRDYEEYRKLSYAEREQYEDSREKSRLVFDSPALVGYLMHEVALGRSEIIEGQTEYHVFANAVGRLRKIVDQEGGQSYDTPENSQEQSKLIMQIGRTIMVHDRVWPNYGGGDTDTRGPVGLLVAKTYDTPGEAIQAFNAVIEAVGLLKEVSAT